MAHEDEVLAAWIETARPELRRLIDAWPRESIQRLNGIQSVVDACLGALEGALFASIFELLTEMAAAAAGRCEVCHYKCERERKTLRVRTTRRPIEVEVWRYRCRSCFTNRSPVREWLGLESGVTTAGLDRALTALSTQMSFGSAAQQMAEQHGHELDRTLVERRTYAVAADAVEFLDERDDKLLQSVMDTPGKREGVERVFLQVDSGGVSVGSLKRPGRDPKNRRQELTPVRGLPRGNRPKSKREVRVAVAWRPGQVDKKVVNLHIAPLKHPEVTGEHMYISALAAGMGDNTHVHCTSDMAQWQVLQFEEQFNVQPRATHCADFYHTIEYIGAAGKAIHSNAHKLNRWIAMQARRLKQGQRAAILADLRKHNCVQDSCIRNDRFECTVVAACRYLTRNGRFMDYPTFIADGLPIGSGEVEGRIRHVVRRRLDVPADWREDNLSLMTALLTIRHSGLWDEFWRWQDERDKKRFQRRLRGEDLNRFRGPSKPRVVAHGTERLDLDDLSPLFDNRMI